MTRLEGKILSVTEKNGVTKEGKPYFSASVLVMDKDNEVSLVRIFDRDGTLPVRVKKCKIGDDVVLGVDKLERLPNRTFDAQGQFV